MFPIFLSVAALYFAYKSNVINREWADVHLRVTNQSFMGWQTGDFFVEDDIFYFTGTMGSLENIVEIMNSATFASNELGMNWMADSIGWDVEEIDSETLPYQQYFIFLALSNDGDQLAENLYVEFNWYKTDDKDELRGDEAVIEGIEPEEWEFGPSVIAPGQWVLIPIVSCFARLDPTGEEIAVRYIGDYFEPVAITYESTVSGFHRIPLDIEDIPQLINAFTEPALPETVKAEDEYETRSAPERGNSNDRTSGRDNRDYRRD